MSGQLTDNILRAIKERGLKPKPRWEFVLRNRFIWLLATLAAILGGVAMATIIFMLRDHDWYVFKYLDRSLLQHVIISIPYLWLVVLVILIVIGLYNIRHTKYGYKYTGWLVILISIVSSLLLGLALVGLGFDSYLHETLMQQVPWYEKLTYTKDDVWIYPEKGLLSGQVVNFLDDKDFDLVDLKKHNWLIKVTDDTIKEDEYPPAIGEQIKLIGKVVEPSVFEVYTIKPWRE